MRASLHGYWLVLWSAQVLHSSSELIRSEASASHSTQWALPRLVSGEPSSLTGAHIRFDQLDRLYSAEFRTKEILPGAVHKNADEQERYLRDFQYAKTAKDTPHMPMFLGLYAECSSTERVDLLQSVIKWLLEVQSMPEEHVGAWVSMLVEYSRRPAKRKRGRTRPVSVNEQAQALYGLYSLISKYGAHSIIKPDDREEVIAIPWQDLVRYIRVAIKVFERRVIRRFDEGNVLPVHPWVKEIFAPRSELGEELVNHERLADITAYEPGFRKIRSAIKDKSSHSILKELPNLEEMALIETGGFSAQTQTAALWYLYHVASRQDDWLDSLPRRRAAEILDDLSKNPMTANPGYTIARHNTKLAEEMVHRLEKGLKASTIRSGPKYPRNDFVSRSFR